MNISESLANHLHQAYFGVNWTERDLQSTLSDVTFKQAIHKVDGFNTILALAFHVNYFVHEVIPVFKGGELKASDAFSFGHPKIGSEEDWKEFKETLWEDARALVKCIRDFPLDGWENIFVDEKYGSYFSNILGIIEHIHYHLGQIVVVKKMIRDIPNFQS